MTAIDDPIIQLLLAIADDKLVLGHRHSDWTGLGPMLEEDIAFSSIAQDEMAHAQALYRLVGERIGRDENQLAFGRTVAQYRCCAIVEVDDEFDWARAILRQFFCDTFDELRLRRLSKSSDAEIAAVASRIAAEESVHVAHSRGWIERLGQTASVRDRLQAAINELAPRAATMLEAVNGEGSLAGSGLYPALVEGPIAEVWNRNLAAVAARSTLKIPRMYEPEAPGGRRGVHLEALDKLLEEMTEVFRIEPEAAW